MFYLSWYQLWTASMPRFEEDVDSLNKFLGGLQAVERYEYYQTDLPRNVSEIIADKYSGLAQNARMGGITAYNVWKIGALLGFWPLISDTAFEENKCPKFLKPLEVLHYEKDGGYYHLKIEVVDIENNADILAQYLHAAVIFIFNTMNLTKHEIIDKINSAVGLDRLKNNNMTQSPQDLDKIVAQDTHVVFPCDLFLLRPNIEHNMLSIIFGRGGGPEELGATFWGQTELSVYDDTQHGLWGMSYKYHERAIVINERNLVRVFDVAFDGYSGGCDSRIMRWDERDVKAFRDATGDMTRPYAGPSMLVFALPPHNNSFDSFPNPVVFHPVAASQDAGSFVPDRGLKCPDILKHCCFHSNDAHCAWATPEINAVYSLYYNALGVDGWRSMPSMAGTPGALAVSDETAVNLFSFSGQMCVINKKGQREEYQGSGHLGPSFVGVASVREGRGLLQTSRQAVLQKMKM
jgi:hypothetical protein